MFIHFPAILLVKTMNSYLHEFCARGILRSDFQTTWRNIKEHASLYSRALRHCKHHNSSARIKDEDRMKTSMTEEKGKQFEQLLFGHFKFFQRWQLEVE